MSEPNCRDCLFSDDWIKFPNSVYISPVFAGWNGRCLISRTPMNRPTVVSADFLARMLAADGSVCECDQFTHWNEGVTA